MPVPGEVVPHHMTIESYGVEVHIRASSAELLARLEPLLPPEHRRVAENLDAQWISVIEEDWRRFLATRTKGETIFRPRPTSLNRRPAAPCQQRQQLLANQGTSST